ncbi:MAG TPA: hypothetical protein VFT36_12955 [Methylomirabilota bacterium]|nr:hypothetical protein [Methylomirabilota bacterium]
MKVYVASKFERKPEVRDLMHAIRRVGHTVVGDWTTHTVEGEPPENMLAMLRAFAKEDRDAVEACDVFALIHDDNCRGGFVELGIALDYRRWPKEPREVCVIGGKGKAPVLGPIFYALPEVRHFDTAGDFINWLGRQP